jgi:hypothetical protein
MPLPIRDNGRIEDIRKVDGDDPPMPPAMDWSPAEQSAVLGRPCAVQGGAGPALPSTGEHAAFCDRHDARRADRATGKPTDQTSRAIHYQRLEAEAKKQFRPKKLPRRHW